MWESCVPLFRENMAHIRRPRPDSGLDFEVKVLKHFQVVPCSDLTERIYWLVLESQLPRRIVIVSLNKLTI